MPIEETVLVRIDAVDYDDNIHAIEVPPNLGLNLMEVCKAAGLPMLDTCGGMASALLSASWLLAMLY